MSGAQVLACGRTQGSLGTRCRRQSRGVRHPLRRLLAWLPAVCGIPCAGYWHGCPRWLPAVVARGGCPRWVPRTGASHRCLAQVPRTGASHRCLAQAACGGCGRTQGILGTGMDARL
jgi:hypothetical protein